MMQDEQAVVVDLCSTDEDEPAADVPVSASAAPPTTPSAGSARSSEEIAAEEAKQQAAASLSACEERLRAADKAALARQEEEKRVAAEEDRAVAAFQAARVALDAAQEQRAAACRAVCLRPSRILRDAPDAISSSRASDESADWAATTRAGTPAVERSVGEAAAWSSMRTRHVWPC